MTEDERQIQVIKEFWYGLPEPEYSWPPGQFRKASYSRWAVDEIMALIYSHPKWRPMRAVEEFRHTMVKYREFPTHYDEISERFYIAESTALQIEEILMAMQ